MHLDLLDTALIAGIVGAGLYGLMPISIILAYRISRTIAFVHAGIASAAAITYWLLCIDLIHVPDFIVQFGAGQNPRRFGDRPELDPFVAFVLAIALGAILGALYGMVVMSRKVAGLSVLTLTIVSLGAMVGLIGIFQYMAVVPDVLPPTPFGEDSYQIGDVSLTRHKLVTLAIVVVLSLGLAALLTRTHTGLIIRALADDQEAGVWCGVHLRSIGTLVYAGSGALAAMAGVLLAATVGPNPPDMIILFLNGLAIAAVGGMRSLPLALVGALVFSLTETALIVGVFGDVERSTEGVLLYGTLLAIIVTMARFRRESVFLLERQSL